MEYWNQTISPPKTVLDFIERRVQYRKHYFKFDLHEKHNLAKFPVSMV